MQIVPPLRALCLKLCMNRFPQMQEELPIWVDSELFRTLAAILRTLYQDSLGMGLVSPWIFALIQPFHIPLIMLRPHSTN